MESSVRTNSTMVDTRPLPMWRELLRRAILLAVLYGIAHLIGLREWTSALLEGSKCSLTERIGCCIYLFLYGSVVWVMPTLVIAALLLALWDARKARS